MCIRFRASFIRFRSKKYEHTPTDPLAWRQNVSRPFLLIVVLDQASRNSRVTDHVLCVWLDMMYMDLSAKYNSCQSRSSRSVQLAWVSYYYSSSYTLHLFFFSIPLIVMLTLLSPSQCSSKNQALGHIASSPSPTSLRHLPKLLSREQFIICFSIHCRLASIYIYPRCKASSAMIILLFPISFGDLI